VIKNMVVASLAVVGLLGLALVVGAQGPGPGPGGGFRRGAHRGRGGPGGWASAKCAPNCPQYQFTFTRTSKRPVLSSSSSTGASTVTNTTTGVIAGDQYGSTYRQTTLPAFGSNSTPQVIIYVKDLDPGVMMDYMENMTKGTYQAHPIKVPSSTGGGANPGWKGPGKGPGGPANRPTPPPPASYTLPDTSYTCADAETTTRSHGANSSSTRVYCPDVHLVLYETQTDPRFGTSTYVLSQYTKTPAAGVLPFTPTGTPVQPAHRGGPAGARQQSTAPAI